MIDPFLITLFLEKTTLFPGLVQISSKEATELAICSHYDVDAIGDIHQPCSFIHIFIYRIIL